MDWIRLKGVECRVRLGVPGDERRRPQKVLIDVGLGLDLDPAGTSDNVEQTVDYWAMERLVRTVAQKGEYRLAERLATCVLEAVLNQDKRLERVSVAVRKRPEVMPRTGEVVVEISRERSSG